MFLTLLIAHTALSLIAIIVGASVVADLLGGRQRAGQTHLFLVTAGLTSGTGFLFPFTQFLPSHGVGIAALLVLAATLPAQYGFRLRGRWRAIYAGGAVASLYFLVFVLIAQVFTRIPALQAAAPTLSEPPFAITQAVTFVVFALIGLLAVRRFQPATDATPAG
ncbi:MAG: hypothetical protein OJJ21_17630 [Ferrovibrio sp.]|uniref:hypothetical protein n=1 Tax=Ferrovibrio sp. TaxID=1917215 RepID=UPI00263203CE|nr:hypothetical protein [Ferrovibrio sp.]MCW0235424.1 hypothetical protein [Ferrovibrio sp.]